MKYGKTTLYNSSVFSLLEQPGNRCHDNATDKSSPCWQDETIKTDLKSVWEKYPNCLIINHLICKSGSSCSQGQICLQKWKVKLNLTFCNIKPLFFFFLLSASEYLLLFTGLHETNWDSWFTNDPSMRAHTPCVKRFQCALLSQTRLKHFNTHLKTLPPLRAAETRPAWLLTPPGTLSVPNGDLESFSSKSSTEQVDLFQKKLKPCTYFKKKKKRDTLVPRLVLSSSKFLLYVHIEWRTRTGGGEREGAAAPERPEL